MVVQSTRPKWKGDTYALPISDGIYLRGNHQSLILQGKSLYPLLEHLIPHLDGNVTLEELTEGLDAERKRMLTSLIEKLLTRQFLTDTSQDHSHNLHPRDLERHAPTIAFIESFQTSPAYRFDRFREQRLLMIGDGPGCLSLVQASMACGIRAISVISTWDDAEAARFRQGVLALFADEDTTAQDIRLLHPLSWESDAEARQLLQAHDALLHITERPLLARAQLLNRLCIEEGKPLIQAIVMGERAWLGPLVCPESGACWECAWRRLQANLTLADQPERYVFRDGPASSRVRALTEQGASLIAQRLLFEFFRQSTQIGLSEPSSQLTCLDLQTFLSESHPFLPHPHCLACRQTVAQSAAQFLEQMQRLQQNPPERDRFPEDSAGYVDAKLGLLTALENSHFVQAPLAVYQATVSRQCPPETLKVVGVSTDAKEARRQAAQKAYQRYAASFLDQRRLLSLEQARQQTVPMLATEDCLGPGAHVSVSEERWTWALDLRRQQLSLVPATPVFASLCGHERGVGSGTTWEEAVCQGLLDWCLFLTLEYLPSSRRAYPRIDLAKLRLNPHVAYLYRLLQTAGEPIAVYDITGSLHVPTLAVCVGEQIVTWSAHCDGEQALSLGFEQAVQCYQSMRFQQPDYGLAPAPDLPANLRSDRAVEFSSPSFETWPDRQEWLLQQLQDNGLSAYALPLDHDPALAQVCPLIARVLLSRRTAS